MLRLSSEKVGRKREERERKKRQRVEHYAGFIAFRKWGQSPR